MTKELTNESDNEPDNKSINKSDNKSTKELVNKSDNESTNELTNKLTNESINESVNKSTKELINKSTNKLANALTNEKVNSNLTSWYDADKFNKILATIDNNNFNHKNKIGKLKLNDINDLINNIKSNTISEADAKKKIYELNEIKKTEIKGKRLIESQKKILSLFDNLIKPIFNETVNESNSSNTKNESKSDNDSGYESDNGSKNEGLKRQILLRVKTIT